MSLTLNEIEEFKSLVAQAPRSTCRKLSGQEMANLKQSNFNEYIKKIKYYARKDLDKITTKNTKLFYKTDSFKDYQNKEQPSNIIKKPKPLELTEKRQPSFYYFGEIDVKELKKYIFLAEECHLLESRYKRAEERLKEKKFVNKIERNVQHSKSPSVQSLNLHLTIKSARKIDEMSHERRRTDYLEKLGRKSCESLPKSFGSMQSFPRKSISVFEALKANI